MNINLHHVCNKECGFSLILGFFAALKPLTSASIGTLEHSVEKQASRLGLGKGGENTGRGKPTIRYR